MNDAENEKLSLKRKEIESVYEKELFECEQKVIRAKTEFENLKSKIENLVLESKKELKSYNSEILDFIQNLRFHGIFVSKTSNIVQNLFDMKSSSPKEFNCEFKDFTKSIQDFISDIIQNHMVITLTKAQFIFCGQMKGRKGKETKLERFENPKIEDPDFGFSNPEPWEKESWEKEYSIEIDSNKIQYNDNEYEAWYTSEQDVYLIELKF